jgi:RNA polymerase sigma-70 factor (ECF subfamily)
MSNMPETRDSLIAQIQDPTNRDAWDQFTQLYRPIVYRLARSRGLQDDDAEDLTQQVLLSVARAIPDWQRQPNTRFRHWLSRIARNAILNALMRSRRDTATGGSDFLKTLNSLPRGTNELETQIEHEYQRQLYRRAAEIVRESVNEATWLAFVHTVVDGEATEAVAIRLGKTIGNVHAARSRLMRRLQTVVRELMEADQ